MLTKQRKWCEATALKALPERKMSLCRQRMDVEDGKQVEWDPNKKKELVYLIEVNPVSLIPCPRKPTKHKLWGKAAQVHVNPDM